MPQKRHIHSYNDSKVNGKYHNEEERREKETGISWSFEMQQRQPTISCRASRQFSHTHRTLFTLFTIVPLYIGISLSFQKRKKRNNNNNTQVWKKNTIRVWLRIWCKRFTSWDRWWEATGYALFNVCSFSTRNIIWFLNQITHFIA